MIIVTEGQIYILNERKTLMKYYQISQIEIISRVLNWLKNFIFIATNLNIIFQGYLTFSCMLNFNGSLKILFIFNSNKFDLNSIYCQKCLFYCINCFVCNLLLKCCVQFRNSMLLMLLNCY